MERQAFVDYLERSCVSEFSGFLLFKELSRKLKGRNPILAEMFSLMARDEARHAGFLNKAMADFGISLDLAKLTKKRTYTFFSTILRAGARTKTAMGMCLRRCCDRSPTCGRPGNRVSGAVSFCYRCLPPTV